MNVKKIFKTAAKIMAVSGMIFAAYKLGKCNGESGEQICHKYDDDCEDDYYNLSDYDEPDCGCVKPSYRRGECE